MNIVIRQEYSEDYNTSENVAREAFWNLYKPGCEEHFVISKLRSHPDFIARLTFVAEVDGEVVGGIFASKSKVISPYGKENLTVTFGPVFVHPKYQRHGIGRCLIEHFIEEATSLKYSGVLTLGYPYHYSPFGFAGGKKYNISMEDGLFYQGLLVLPLDMEKFSKVQGSAIFSNVFEVCEDSLEEYDKNFEQKEKLVQPSQQEYQQAVGLLD